MKTYSFTLRASNFRQSPIIWRLRSRVITSLDRGSFESWPRTVWPRSEWRRWPSHGRSSWDRTSKWFVLGSFQNFRHFIIRLTFAFHWINLKAWFKCISGIKQDTELTVEGKKAIGHPLVWFQLQFLITEVIENIYWFYITYTVKVFLDESRVRFGILLPLPEALEMTDAFSSIGTSRGMNWELKTTGLLSLPWWPGFGSLYLKWKLLIVHISSLVQLIMIIYIYETTKLYIPSQFLILYNTTVYSEYILNCHWCFGTNFIYLYTCICPTRQSFCPDTSSNAAAPVPFERDELHCKDKLPSPCSDGSTSVQLR